MPGRDFFARMQPEFAQQVGAARHTAERQADVELLIGKAEYEYRQVRRELAGLVEEAVPATVPADAGAPHLAAPASAPAKAA